MAADKDMTAVATAEETEVMEKAAEDLKAIAAMEYVEVMSEDEQAKPVDMETEKEGSGGGSDGNHRKRHWRWWTHRSFQNW